MVYGVVFTHIHVCMVLGYLHNHVCEMCVKCMVTRACNRIVYSVSRMSTVYSEQNQHSETGNRNNTLKRNVSVFGTLGIQEILSRQYSRWGSGIGSAICSSVLASFLILVVIFLLVFLAASGKRPALERIEHVLVLPPLCL